MDKNIAAADIIDKMLIPPLMKWADYLKFRNIFTAYLFCRNYETGN